MIKAVTVKAGICAGAFLLSLGFGVKAQAETSISDTGIAGISAVLETYYDANSEDKTSAADQYMETLKEESSNVTEVKSPYANLGISIASDYVNIRKKPNTESEIVGKLYKGCATDILETKGNWVKIHSGNVDGYIKSEYLAIGDDAEKLVDKYSTKYATVVNTQTLRVREKPSMKEETQTITLIPEGESYYVIKEYGKWAKIQIDDGQSEEEDGGGETGYVSKDYIKINVEFEYAISIEEEQAKLKAEQEAKEAEQERLEQLAIQKEEARKAAEQKAEQKEQSSQGSSNSSTQSSAQTSSGSSSGSSIANYAVKFVGNPYVWGGTSLTGGADCSGFVQSLYSNYGISIPRTSRDQASGAGTEVSINDRQPGDLIFYCNSSGTVNHVAMYIGNNQVVHASNPRDGIKISSYNYRSPYKIRRVIR